MSREVKFSLEEIPVPADLELEKDVVALAAANESTIDEISSILGSGAFADPYWAEAWGILLDMHRKGDHIDAVTFCAKLDPSVASDVAVKMMMFQNATIEAVSHAETLKVLATRRRLYQATCALLKLAASPTSTVPGMVAALARATESISEEASISDGVTITEAIDNLATTLEEKANGGGNQVTTGFSVLDSELTGGMAPGQLIILSARPSVGKTAVMLQMAVSAARAGKPVMIYSLEMSELELAERYMLSTERVDPYTMASGKVDWNQFETGRSVFADLPLRIDDRTVSLEGIISSITLNASRGKCSAAYIDYLGFIRNGDDRENLAQKLGKITGTLKSTARKVGIPIVLLAQLNRDSVKEKRAPQLSDLRDSGSIEQDADAVLMLDRSDTGLAMYIRKNRKGAPNRGVMLRPNSTYTMFDESGMI